MLTNQGFDNQLKLRGILIGTVLSINVSATIGNATAHTSSSRMPYYDFTRACQLWVRKINQTIEYPTGEDPMEVALHTVCFPDARDGKLAVDGAYASFSEWFKLLSYPNSLFDDECEYESDDRDGSQKATKRILHHMCCQGVDDHDDELWKFHSLVKRLANYAFLFLDTGHIGVAFHLGRAGDRVALLAGSDCPFLLRANHNGCFRVVAPAYIHGFMRGEMWPCDKSLLREITLI